MARIDILIAELKNLENELDRITIQKQGTSQWAPGVHDQFNSHSYSYKEYTNKEKANNLISRIEYLKGQIALEKRENERASYSTDAKTNPAIEARLAAQKRYFGKNKLQQAMLVATGQKKKFEKLWNKALSEDKKIQEKTTEELNRMFR